MRKIASIFAIIFIFFFTFSFHCNVYAYEQCKVQIPVSSDAPISISVTDKDGVIYMQKDNIRSENMEFVFDEPGTYKYRFQAFKKEKIAEYELLFNIIDDAESSDSVSGLKCVTAITDVKTGEKFNDITFKEEKSQNPPPANVPVKPTTGDSYLWLIALGISVAAFLAAIGIMVDVARKSKKKDRAE